MGLMLDFSGEEIQDTVFVSGLPEGVNEGDLSSYFGAIGIIKVSLFINNLYFFSWAIIYQISWPSVNCYICWSI